MASSLLERARNGRHSGAVLKTQLSNIRSRDESISIFVFEGHQDVGPYTVWISRVRDEFRYTALPGQGKDQLLDLRRRLLSDLGGLGKGVYFFIDNDYDGYKEQAPGPDIFCTRAYSIENYLVTERVLKSLLGDEFRCVAVNDDEVKVVQLYREVLQKFCLVMRVPNERIFQARKLKISCSGINNSINRYISIELKGVETRYTDEDLKELIPLEREPTLRECADLADDFNRMDSAMCHRGKFLYEFFLRWLELLANERKVGVNDLFEEKIDLKFSAQRISKRLLATHSSFPEGLDVFLENITIT